MEMRSISERTLHLVNRYVLVYAARPYSKHCECTQKALPKQRASTGNRGERQAPKRESAGKAGGKQRESQGKARPKKGKPGWEGGNGPIIYNTGRVRNRPESTLYNIKRAKQCKMGGEAQGGRFLEF